MIKTSKNSSPLIFKTSLKYLTVLLFFSFVIIFLFVQFDRNNALKSLQAESESQIEYQKSLLLDHFNNIKSDLLFLPQLNELLRYRELNNKRDRALIEKEFLEFSRYNSEYDQIRYLDEEGNEIIRINNNQGNPSKVQQNDLQNKKDRYYFRETMSVNRGEVYFSPFDLNMERNQVEQPLKPMIRMGTPVFNSAGEKKGIVILNYLGVNLLDNLIQATATEPGVFSLINKDGFWLYNDEPEDEWGFMFPEKNNRNFAELYPEKWKQITTDTYNQVLTEDCLITSTIIRPFPETSVSNDYWILVNTIFFEKFGINWSQILFRNRLIGILILLVDFIIAFIISSAVVQRNILKTSMENSALHDPLTNLPNRRFLVDRVENTITQSRRYKFTFAIIYLDLDGFKAVNDSLGHNAGDQLLKMVSSRLMDSVRSADTVSRIGGDEFVILISQIKNREDCDIIAKKILKCINLEYELEQGTVNVQGSLGIVVSDPDVSDSTEELLKKADSAMYDVKRSGKNNYKIYSHI